MKNLHKPNGGILNKKPGDTIIFSIDEFPHLDNIVIELEIDTIEKFDTYFTISFKRDKRNYMLYCDFESLKIDYDGHIDGINHYSKAEYNVNRIYVCDYNDDMFHIMLFTNRYYYYQFMRDQCKHERDRWIANYNSFSKDLKDSK